MFKLFLGIATITMMSFSLLAMAATTSHDAASVAHQKVATKTVTLSVPSMTCRVCPITVKKALEDVKGVSKVSVDFDAKTATITFNPHQADVSDLTKATKKSGYPSSLKKAVSPTKTKAK